MDRYEKCFDEAFIADKIREWLAGFSSTDQAEACGLQDPINFTEVSMDTTCVKANIHFPVDWVLFRDAARSLLLAINTIRAQGLKNRMIEPQILLKKMNSLCIEMTNTRRKKDSKKQRKAILRKMKKLTKCIEKHAKKYRKLLTEEWQKTEWSEAQTQQVIGRLDLILEQLPAAIKQAHDRIIGERKIAQQDKIISFYDKDTHVIVRGKAGNEVEFGQSLLISEQENGLIIDWELFGKESPSDSRILISTVDRIENYYGELDSVCTDRGFSSKKSDEALKEKGIYNATCPKDPAQLQERLKEERFKLSQTRRSQTEGRIGIFKNVFLGRPLRSRITLNKRHAINWSVLSHNLWVLSRKIITDEKILLEVAA